ncbi:MAG: radical SAM protein [Desulfohalobiaceae bacterium]|nr:radical SAM protein [Desulfohalobiaceae bacterium]
MSKHIFGPVPSRRFGRSLGIDLNKRKTCTLDCVFCQLGQTNHLTATREEFVPVETVLSEIREWLEKDGQADVLTFSGSGEPTLHPGLGRIIQGIRSLCTLDILLLTNGTLFDRESVRQAAKQADMVKYSLSAWDQESFEQINRPHPDISFSAMLKGLAAFRREFSGRLFQEVFVIPDINDQEEQMRRIAGLSEDIQPDRIQLNTAVRPPAQSWVKPVSREKLERLARCFDPPAEIIAEFRSERQSPTRINEERILDMLRRRPCTQEDIAHSFNLHPNEVAKSLGELVSQGKVQTTDKDGISYYIQNQSPGTPGD